MRIRSSSQILTKIAAAKFRSIYSLGFLLKEFIFYSSMNHDKRTLLFDHTPLIFCFIATRDATTLNAIDILAKCNGKVDLALEKLCQNPMPIIPQRMWVEEDTKAFIKGNFFLSRENKTL